MCLQSFFSLSAELDEIKQNCSGLLFAKQNKLFSQKMFSYFFIILFSFTWFLSSRWGFLLEWSKNFPHFQSLREENKKKLFETRVLLLNRIENNGKAFFWKIWSEGFFGGGHWIEVKRFEVTSTKKIFWKWTKNLHCEKQNSCASRNLLIASSFPSTYNFTRSATIKKT